MHTSPALLGGRHELVAGCERLGGPPSAVKTGTHLRELGRKRTCASERTTGSVSGPQLVVKVDYK